MTENINAFISNICYQFINSCILSAEPIGDGHINDTYLVTASDCRYVAQRIKDTADTAKYEYNYGLYADILASNGIKFPIWLKSKAGTYFYTDGSGYNWRMYSYIDGDIICAPPKIEQLFFLGQGLKKLHILLQKIKDKPKPVYPHLHDLMYYYDMYCKVKDDDKNICTEYLDPAIEIIISADIDKMLRISVDKTSVVHGDTKLANILFKDGKVTGFIDFDTLMKGSLIEDVADCIRSCCIDNGQLNTDKADELVKGYLDTCDDFNDLKLNNKQDLHNPYDVSVEHNPYDASDNNNPDDIIRNDIKQLPDVFNKICFELGLRYYTDAISKNKCFKEKYPGYHLERARSLFKVKWPV